jgi:hypothetical protein
LSLPEDITRIGPDRLFKPRGFDLQVVD